MGMAGTSIEFCSPSRYCIRSWYFSWGMSIMSIIFFEERKNIHVWFFVFCWHVSARFSTLFFSLWFSPLRTVFWLLLVSSLQAPISKAYQLHCNWSLTTVWYFCFPFFHLLLYSFSFSHLFGHLSLRIPMFSNIVFAEILGSMLMKLSCKHNCERWTSLLKGSCPQKVGILLLLLHHLGFLVFSMMMMMMMMTVLLDDVEIKLFIV